MTGERVLASIRMKTGDQNFVFSVKTPFSEYILRMTDITHKHKFYAAVKCQEMLLLMRGTFSRYIRSVVVIVFFILFIGFLF